MYLFDTQSFSQLWSITKFMYWGVILKHTLRYIYFTAFQRIILHFYFLYYLYLTAILSTFIQALYCTANLSMGLYWSRFWGTFATILQGTNVLFTAFIWLSITTPSGAMCSTTFTRVLYLKALKHIFLITVLHLVWMHYFLPEP